MQCFFFFFFPLNDSLACIPVPPFFLVLLLPPYPQTPKKWCPSDRPGPGSPPFTRSLWKPPVQLRNYYSARLEAAHNPKRTFAAKSTGNWGRGGKKIRIKVLFVWGKTLVFIAIYLSAPVITQYPQTPLSGSPHWGQQHKTNPRAPWLPPDGFGIAFIFCASYMKAPSAPSSPETLFSARRKYESFKEHFIREPFYKWDS